MNTKSDSNVQYEISNPAMIAITPLVSVHMMTFNHGPYLAEAIEGVIAQKADFPIELIIGEDCSTDNTREIALDFQRRYPHLIRVIYSEQNVGGHNNFRRVLEACRGELIALCEGDDYWTDSSKLQKQVDFLEMNPDYALCLHNSIVVHENGNASHVAKTKIWDTCTLEELVTNFNDFTRDFLVSPAHTSSLVFKNHLITEFPDWFHHSKSGDLPLMILLCKYGKAKFINEMMSVYRIHPGGISSSSHHATDFYENRAKMYEGLRSSLGYQCENVFNTLLAKYYRHIKMQKIKNIIRKSIKLVKLDRIIALARAAKNRLTYQQRIQRYRKILANQVSNLKKKQQGRIAEEGMQKIHTFLDSLQSPDVFGSYRYAKRSKVPILYASIYAVLLKHLSCGLQNLSQPQKETWGKYINSFQCEGDGLYRDPLLNNAIAESEDWWGWRHLSAHVVTALTALGAKPKYPFSFLNFIYEPGCAEKWIAALPWREKPDFVSNTVMNYGVLLQYERDFQGNTKAGYALEEIFAFLDRTQNPETGLWGKQPIHTPQELSVAVQTAYHLWNLYFYDGRPIQYQKHAIDSCLATQNWVGGYGVSLNSSACEDIDSIDPLCRFYFMTDYRRDDIQRSLEKALPWILVNQMKDGGFVFRRFEGFAYGHDLMTTRPEESQLFATWFRILCIAYICETLNLPGPSSGGWRWIRCPGYQFWNIAPEVQSAIRNA